MILLMLPIICRFLDARDVVSLAATRARFNDDMWCQVSHARFASCASKPREMSWREYFLARTYREHCGVIDEECAEYEHVTQISDDIGTWLDIANKLRSRIPCARCFDVRMIKYLTGDIIHVKTLFRRMHPVFQYGCTQYSDKYGKGCITSSFVVTELGITPVIIEAKREQCAQIDTILRDGFATFPLIDIHNFRIANGLFAIHITPIRDELLANVRNYQRVQYDMRACLRIGDQDVPFVLNPRANLQRRNKLMLIASATSDAAQWLRDIIEANDLISVRIRDGVIYMS